jgi:phosphatidylinositol alpha-1,6-mannosyltransferase
VSHLLVTNDFPPKVGGIQSYLWELWRRLPPGETTVLTTAYPGDREWDATQPFRIERTREKVLLPTPGLREQIDKLAADIDAELVVLDPALPLGLIGEHLERPYALVVHGAEVTVPGRLPISRGILGRVLGNAVHVVAAGSYPAAEAAHAAGRPIPTTNVPPGVDVDRFRTLDLEERVAARRRFDLPVEGPVVVSVSRLVPRKGMDTLIDAAARLAPAHPSLSVAIAGGGRDERRLRGRIAEKKAPVRLLGRVSDDDLPALYGCGDVFAMLCRNRWGGLEQEGFGIVFLEAAACGVPQVAGDSGGAAEAVADGDTGYVVRRPHDARAAAAAIEALLRDPVRRAAMGDAARGRAERVFSYDVLSRTLLSGLNRAKAANRYA